MQDLNVEAYRSVQQCKKYNYQGKFHDEEGVVEEVKILQILSIKLTLDLSQNAEKQFHKVQETDFSPLKIKG